MRSIKATIIKFGAYQPARWIADHVIDRSRSHILRMRTGLFQQLLVPGDLCFDVGANIGDYTAALIAAGARVVAIDPQPSAIDELRARFASNKQVIIEPVALGPYEGSTDFYIREHHGASGLIENWETTSYVRKIQVPIVRIENLIRTYGRPKYIKIDVEGSELGVLLGLESPVPLISFEYHLNDQDYAAKMEILRILKRHGAYSLNLLPDGAESFYWTKFCSESQFNTVFPTLLRQKRSPFGDLFVKFN